VETPKRRGAAEPGGRVGAGVHPERRPPWGGRRPRPPPPAGGGRFCGGRGAALRPRGPRRDLVFVLLRTRNALMHIWPGIPSPSCCEMLSTAGRDKRRQCTYKRNAGRSQKQRQRRCCASRQMRSSPALTARGVHMCRRGAAAAARSRAAAATRCRPGRGSKPGWHRS
jgi:hypothetical protein